MIVDRVYSGMSMVSVVPEKDERVAICFGMCPELYTEKSGKLQDDCSTDKWRYAMICSFAFLGAFGNTSRAKSFKYASPLIKKACDAVYGGAQNCEWAIITAPEWVAGIAKVCYEGENKIHEVGEDKLVYVKPFESRETAEKYLKKLHKKEGGSDTAEEWFNIVEVAGV